LNPEKTLNPLPRPGALPVLLAMLGGALLALALALMTVIVAMNPPMDDVKLLFTFMLASGLLSVGLAYGLYQRGITQWFGSLRWTLLATCIMTVMLVFVNVLVTARLMFISEHDLILTTALLLFGGLVSIISVHFLSRTLIDRISQLGAAAARVSQGDLGVRLPVLGRDELTQAAATFNQMAEGLAALEAQKATLEQTRRDLIAWVSHDLRTPLAVIRALNESILDGVVSDSATVQRYTQTIQREVGHLGRMIDDLFDLAQIDAGHLRLSRERVSLRDLISDTLGGLSARAAALGVTLSGEVADEIDILSVAPDKLQRVLSNLLDNALRYTPPGEAVRVLAEADPSGGIRVSVHNRGQPIPAAELPHIFNRFYRGEPSRAQGNGAARGTGLGLAIVRAFVEAHGGAVTATSSREAGTTFTFTLPASAHAETRPAIPALRR
jgi:signal transduction histidine kinase